MKVVLKIAGALLAVLALTLLSAVGSPYLNAQGPPRPVGFTVVQVPDPEDRPLEVGIWFPTDSPPGRTLVGLSGQLVARDGSVVGDDLPLVVVSHGSGGLFSSHSDTALALASAGFVVAAVTHTGDNARDQSYVGTARWLVDRPRHVHRVLEYMLEDWPAHQQIDPQRVGAFGFSAGAFTILVSIGGVPDTARIASHCATDPELACTMWPQHPASATPATAWVHEPAIQAAVIAAPGFGFAFEPGGPGAEHFSFLAPCPSWLLPSICADPGGFDRVAFHRQFNSAVVAFYESQLGVTTR